MVTGWCGPADDSFGPTVKGCRNNFDFTLLFEDAFLSLGPSILLVLIVPLRLAQLLKSTKKVNRGLLQLLKVVGFHLQHSLVPFLDALQINSLLYFTLQVVLLVRWTRLGAFRTHLSVAAGALALVDAIAIGILSFFDHSRSVRPSTILQIYLIMSLMFDVVRTRTLWLLRHDQILASVFTASVVSKAGMLWLEVTEKRSLLEPAYRNLNRESTSGFANTSVFWWLNKPLHMGARKLFGLEDLENVDEEILSSNVQHEIQLRWEQCRVFPNMLPTLKLTSISIQKGEVRSTAQHGESFSVVSACGNIPPPLHDRIYLCTTISGLHFDQQYRRCRPCS